VIDEFVGTLKIGLRALVYGFFWAIIAVPFVHYVLGVPFASSGPIAVVPLIAVIIVFRLAQLIPQLSPEEEIKVRIIVSKMGNRGTMLRVTAALSFTVMLIGMTAFVSGLIYRLAGIAAASALACFYLAGLSFLCTIAIVGFYIVFPWETASATIASIRTTLVNVPQYAISFVLFHHY